MPANKHAQAKLRDLNDKLQNTKDVARTEEPGKRDKADRKLLEQEIAAEKLKAKRPAPAEKKAESEIDAKLDKALSDSFPGSDPVSFVEAAPMKKHDRGLSTVPNAKDPKDK